MRTGVPAENRNPYNVMPEIEANLENGKISKIWRCLWICGFGF